MKSAVMGAGYVGLASDAYLAEVGCEWHENVNEKDCFKVKRIYVKPETSPSLQKYHHRAGRWIKAAEVTDGGKAASFIDQLMYTPLWKVHYLHPGTIPLEIVEVQSDSYLDTDDTVRFEDPHIHKS